MTSRPLVDEQVALWAAQLVTPRRAVDAGDVARLRARIVADLPALDAAARDWTRLGADLPPTRVRVVGRTGWVRANLAALRGAFDPLAERLQGRRTLARRALGVQVGSLLGLLSTKVLGQYVLPLGREGSGELVVVGPNVLGLGEEFGPRADDISRTVVIHEIVHRLQFDAVPWLADHLRGLLARYLRSARLDPGALVEAAGRLPEAISQARSESSIAPIVEAILTEDQVEVIRSAQGLMSLLEGHGNAAMFAGAPDLVEDPEGVRAALQRRRSDVTTRVLQAVAGLEMKKRQYLEGEAFVGAVVDRVGIDGLNRVFERPEHLPSHDEVRDPDAWLARVGFAV